MKAMKLVALNQMQMMDVPDPVLREPHDVLLKLERVGVCGSDVHYYETGRIGSQVVQYPFTVGHECAASIVKIGPAVTNFKPGQTVAVEPAMPCFQCDQCLAGRENTCRKLKFLGCPGQAEGCLCEYLVMPDHCLYLLDGKVSMDQGTLCEPLSIGYYAVQQSGMKAKDNIGILGSGPIGLSVFACARGSGCREIFMTDKIDARLDAAQKAGASWIGNPTKINVVERILQAQPLALDIIYECSGEQEAMDQALDLLKPGGKLMLIGIPRTSRISFSIDQLRRKEITVINVRRQNHCVQKCIAMVADGRVQVDFMITHRFPFAQTIEAFELVKHYRDGVIKAVIDF